MTDRQAALSRLAIVAGVLGVILMGGVSGLPVASGQVPTPTPTPSPITVVVPPQAPPALTVRDALIPLGTALGALLGAFGVGLAARITSRAQDRRTREELVERGRLLAFEEQNKSRRELLATVDDVFKRQCDLAQLGAREWSTEVGTRKREATRLALTAIEAKARGLGDSRLSQAAADYMASMTAYLAADPRATDQLAEEARQRFAELYAIAVEEAGKPVPEPEEVPPR